MKASPTADQLKKATAQQSVEKAASKAGLSEAELNANLTRLAEMVKNGEYKLASEMIAGFTDAWLFEALLADSSIETPFLVTLPRGALEQFKDQAQLIGFLAWAYAPASAELNASFKDKNQPLKLKVQLDGMPLEAIEACLTEHIFPHFPKLNLVSETCVYLRLRTLSDAAAESLSKYEVDLLLPRLRTLSDAAAESLSKHKGELSLYGPTTLSDAAAESLSKHKGHLSLGDKVSAKVSRFRGK